MGLIEFLRARLDEDEAVAREAEGLHWRATTPYLGSVDVDDERNRSVIMDREGGAMSEETGAHVARWDPARVLGEVEAKRRIIDRCVPVVEMEGWEYTDAPDLAEAVLDALAQPYVGHPDFDPAWLARPPGGV